MKLIVRLLARIVILAALAVVLSFAIPAFVHRNVDNKAVLADINNPSAENNTILLKESGSHGRRT
jgi:hypothetical protein